MTHKTKATAYAAAIIAAVATNACSSGNDNIDLLVGEAMREAGSNAGELQAAIDRYDDDRRDPAEYAVAATWGAVTRTGPGMDSIESLYRELTAPWLFDSTRLARGMRYAAMPLSQTKDATTITTGYLTENIDDALRLWRDRKWNRNLPQEVFCEMLLPYRIGDEPLTRWREPYSKWLDCLNDTLAKCENSVDAARIIADHIGACPYQDQLSTPHRSATDLLEAPVGYCREDCDRTVYAMRSMGVPVAIDRMLVSPENGGSHMWTVVWDNVDSRTRMFDNGEYRPTRDSLHYDKRRKGKIYRATFLPDLDRIKRYSNAPDAPSVLLNSRLKDVTAEYFGHNEAEVEIWGETEVSEANAVYLGVFANRQFRPVDIARLNGNTATFTDIEPNLIYAPVTARGEVCGYPFMLRSDGQTHSFIPNEGHLETVTLTRKFPMRFHHINRFKTVVGVRIQSGPTARGPWIDLETITTPPAHSYRRIASVPPQRDRYIRLLKPEGDAALISMLLACRDTLGLDRMPLSVVGGAAQHERYDRITKAGYTFALERGAEDCIVRIDSPDDVAALFLLPPNDDNFVVPAQEYELLYFAGPEGWKSAGRKMSSGFSVDFKAPQGAVLWLRNLTKGREEQIFVWYSGRQLFNIDLHDFDLDIVTTAADCYKH